MIKQYLILRTREQKDWTYAFEDKVEIVYENGTMAVGAEDVANHYQLPFKIEVQGSEYHVVSRIIKKLVG